MNYITCISKIKKGISEEKAIDQLILGVESK